jgi:hypothetical protein
MTAVPEKWGAGFCTRTLGVYAAIANCGTEEPSGLDIKLRLKRWMAGWRARKERWAEDWFASRSVGRWVYIWLQAQCTEGKEGRTSYLGVESADNL